MNDESTAAPGTRPKDNLAGLAYKAEWERGERRTRLDHYMGHALQGLIARREYSVQGMAEKALEYAEAAIAVVDAQLEEADG